jgi:hypothetical protein
MNANGNIELLGHGQIGVELRIAGSDARVLVRDFCQHGELPRLIQLAHIDRRHRVPSQLELHAGDEPAGRRLAPLPHPIRSPAQDAKDSSAIHDRDRLLHQLTIGLR